MSDTSSSATELNTDTISHHEALIYVMVTMSAVDRTISDQELARIGNIVSQLPIFKGFDSEMLVPASEACGTILGRENGLNDLLNVIALALPESLYETAYAMAVDIAAIDLDVTQEELRFLQLLCDKLSLDKLAIAAIERGAKARHATL
ncbi:MAG: tellurite resistance TerB family protein [Pseudomonadota bacterium]